MAHSPTGNILIIHLVLVTALAFQTDILGVENPTGSNGLVQCNLRATRFNRTVYVITGNLTAKPPFVTEPHQFLVHTDIYFSSKGNSQYTLTPYRLAERNFCDFLNTDYKKYIMSLVKGHSTLPVSDDNSEDLCANVFKPTNKERYYEIYDIYVDQSIFPPFAILGYYKFDFQIKNGSLLDTQVLFIAHIYR